MPDLARFNGISIYKKNLQILAVYYITTMVCIH